MPIPKPKPKEDRQTFVSRCISVVHDLDPKRPQKQIIAICFDAWRKSKRKRTTQETQEIVEWYESREKERPIEISEALSSEDFKDLTLEEMVDKLKGWEKEKEELGYVHKPITKKESKNIELSSHIHSLKTAIGERMSQKSKEELTKWYESKFAEAKKNETSKEEPSWVQMARRLLASKKGSTKLLEYWKKRLAKYEASKK